MSVHPPGEELSQQGPRPALLSANYLCWVLWGHPLWKASCRRQFLRIRAGDQDSDLMLRPVRLVPGGCENE